MIGHIPDIPPIVCRKGRIEQENYYEESYENHYDGHKFKSSYLTIISFGFAVPYPLYVIGKHDYGYGKDKIIADIRIVFKKIPTELVSAVFNYVKDAERK